MTKKTETLFKEKFMNELKNIPNCWFLKTNEVSVRGIPDIIGCINGKFFAIELKINGEKPDKLQSYTLSRINKTAGGVALTATPSTAGDIMKDLRCL